MVWKYDVDELRDTARGLSALKADYGSATSGRTSVGAAFGSDDIAGAVEEFVDSWSTKRDKQIESLARAVEALDSIVENYVALDQSGVSGLQSPAP